MYRRRLIVTGAAIAIMAGSFTWYALRGYDIVNAPPRPGPVVAFGDSLVAGSGASEGNDFVSLLAQKIERPILNLGVPGNTTMDALARLESVRSQHPSVVFILLGGNDYLRRLSSATTFENLKTIILALQEDGAVTVLIGVRGGVLKDNFESSFEKLAEETGSVYVPDALDGILGNANLMADAVHPNDAGYALIAEKVHKKIRTLCW